MTLAEGVDVEVLASLITVEVVVFSLGLEALVKIRDLLFGIVGTHLLFECPAGLPETDPFAHNFCRMNLIRSVLFGPWPDKKLNQKSI